MQIFRLLFFSGAASGCKIHLRLPKKLLFAQAAVEKSCDGTAVHAASDKD